MADFYEIDFLDVEAKKSGDAIPLRYEIDGQQHIHVTDGGFQNTGDAIVEHIKKYYNTPSYIDAVIVSHPDGDHAGGLRKLFEEYKIGTLWMLRPWLYANELINRFSRFTSVENLIKRLKDLYPNLVALEDLANDNGVPIYEPLQGVSIGAFIVMAPTKARYLDLVVESDKTPEASDDLVRSLLKHTGTVLEKAMAYVRASWGVETFPEDDTSAENNMSVIQFARLCGETILLTADAGRAALDEAADFAPNAGLSLPGVNRIQVPHHGSRHNVSTAVLDRWLGQRLTAPLADSKSNFTAIISAAKEDKNHPRRSVVRAFIHRGGKVITTENGSKRTGHNAPKRVGWVPATILSYPAEEESV